MNEYNEYPDDVYEEFVGVCEDEGYEFPCTKEEFHARAAWFADDAKLVDFLCRKGIGPDYKE